MIKISLASISDVGAYAEHVARHGAESGTGGDIIFSPYEEPWSGTVEELARIKGEKWQALPTAIGWERCWVISEGGIIYGDLKLVQSPPLLSAVHRATLMMGIERGYRGLGYGSKLIRMALDWAAAQSSLEWIDLQVFAHNLRARKLYESFGFKEMSVTKDLFRVNGQSIDDVKMSRRVHP